MANHNDTKSASEETTGVTSQENVSPRNAAPRSSSNKQQIRHRASVACASCRERRIRCVVPKGDNECTQCKRSGTDCVIKNDDERRRPISKAYMSSLSERIALLEGLLEEKGVEPPPAAHPPKTRHEGQSKSSDEQIKDAHNQTQPPVQPSTTYSPLPEVPSPPDSANEEFSIQESDQQAASQNGNSSSYSIPPPPGVKETSPFRMLDPRQDDMVHRLLSTKGNLAFDQLSGRIRFFGPTANSHVYTDTQDHLDAREPPEQVRRAERIIRSLSSETHTYLMDNFWGYYNAVLNIIHQEAFEADRDAQSPRFYSSFLHIAILAMGFRFADFGRDDMRRITIGSRESTLHREAKYMLDIELERPGGIPSVQALLLLGDLECGVGRDNTGWMYSGMANRLAFDIGLHLDCRDNGISDIEIDIRHMAMRACVIYDKYWALFLGRPTSIKNQDIGMDLLSKHFSQLSSMLQDGTSTPDKKSTGIEIYEQLIELMELAGRIVETRENNRVSSSRNANISPDQQGITDAAGADADAEDNAYLHVINLDRQLQNWYRRLPDHLQWKPANIKTAPYSFFLLHQQYHVSMILLHRPWAKYGASGDGASTGSHPSPEAHAPQTPHDRAALPFGAINTATDPHLLGLGMGDPHSMVDDSRTSLSRSICTQQAIRVARIFWQHRQRFDGTKIFVTGIQHAGTAATALIAALAHNASPTDRSTYLGYLEILACAVSDMSHTYHPAARMDTLLQAVLAQLRPEAEAQQMDPWSGPSIPVRRDSTALADAIAPASKRRRPAGSRRASEFTRPPPPFFAPGPTQPTQPTPPQSSHSFGARHYSNQLDPAMYTLSSTTDTSHPGFSLDFLSGSAIDNDGDETNRPADDYVVVPPQSDAWSLTGVSGGDGGNAIWNAGPAGLSASSVLGGGVAPSMLSHGLYSGSRGETDGLRGAMASVGEKGLDDGKPREAGGMDWMDSEGGLDALSPVSLSGLVNSVTADKTRGTDIESGGPARNHDLDFFSF
ncbi:hypothetical protein VDGD_01189 [Verticillium dahliae]|nr:hypothetical protein VDGD_01189 [Verticillium dahliae]